MTPILGIWASQISGRLWEPAGAYDALATVTVPSGGLSSITFAGIPTGYKHLQIRGIGFTTNNIGARFNGDSSASYSYHRLIGNGSSASAGGASSSGRTLATFGGGASLSYPVAYIVDVLDYASTSKTKTIRTLTGHDENSTTGEVALYSNLWTATPAAITSITLLNENGSNLGEYSQFALYGIK